MIGIEQTDPDRYPMCVSFSNEPIRVHQKKFEKYTTW
jgi:hypothetical protein